MKDHSILEKKAESARTNCPSCTNPARYSCSELSSLFLFSATCFLGFRTTVRPAALVSTFLLQHRDASQMCFVPQEPAQPRDSGFSTANLGSNSLSNALGADQMTSDTILLCPCGFLNDLLEVYITESLLKEV